jgi:hypothetical protein
MFAQLRTLNTAQGFAANARPYFVGEVIDNGGEAISATEYFAFSSVTEFRYSNEISRAFRGNNALRWLSSFGEGNFKIIFILKFS